MYVGNAERDKGGLGTWLGGWVDSEKQGDAEVTASEDGGAKETEEEIQAVHTQKR